MANQAKPDQAKIAAAVQVLIDEGRKNFLPQYQPTTDRWECLGMALSTEDDCAGMIRAAFTFLEEWNYHTECEQLQAAMPWAFPKE